MFRLGQSFLIVVAIAGCLLPEEDSWKHYLSGGMYPTGSPSMSPDGSSIVYSSPRTGNGDIYAIARDGTSRVRLTDSPAFEADPLYSPDGSKIAFERETYGCRHLWLMDKDGTNQEQLTDGPVLDDVGSFAPDGSRLFFRRSSQPTGLGRLVSAYELDLASEQPSPRKLDGYPAFSPVGGRIAYDVYNPVRELHEIWIADADGSNKRCLADGYRPQFSPDGKTIIFCRESKPLGCLCVMMHTDGSNKQQLGILDRPVFTSDGRYILYFSPDDQGRLSRMNTDGSERIGLSAMTGHADELRRCDDGFVCRLVSGDDRIGDIYVINTNKWTVKRIGSMR